MDRNQALMRKMINDTCRVILDPSVIEGVRIWVNYTYDGAEHAGVLSKPHWENMPHYSVEEFIALFSANEPGFKGGLLFLMQKEPPPNLVYDHERRSESFG